MDRFEFERGSRTKTGLANALHEDIALMLGKPASTGFATFRHPLTSSRTMSLNEKQRKYLRGLAHGRDPLVMIGQSGLSEAVTRELDTALTAHELVKVRARVGDRDERDLILDELATQTGSELVQRIGNVGVFFRQRTEKSRIVLPD
ncbi:MAG TPA: YhbY family RNA-binding protein [Steroidobacteraceae bacterium]|nr:YhbY family RNA-binding protein [Steroidobacteraceae bacterium]